MLHLADIGFARDGSLEDDDVERPSPAPASTAHMADRPPPMALVAGRRGPGNRSLFVRLMLSGLAAVLGAGAASPAATAFGKTETAGARITNVVITETDSPTFEGLSFGSVGQYEYLAGYVEGEVDPDNPRNALIVNLDGAPRNANGNVEYRVDLAILKPIDLSRGNARILYDVNNRGNKYALGHRINGAPGNATNEAPLAEHAGTGFLMEEATRSCGAAGRATSPRATGGCSPTFPSPGTPTAPRSSSYTAKNSSSATSPALPPAA
jgi:hypothetical protein